MISEILAINRIEKNAINTGFFVIPAGCLQSEGNRRVSKISINK